ncbi:hypothetical protein K488DRAFT_83651 [Vararia minispora EC-137]|uniref:Uncharacterized protein n=1 Tax=Vararia minispora EC-137 TaxID=1314806 RepID=A0ACB8QSE2_9AGAM|nr:hypothetical protein K488DRAFT_83651 [Vararia minispora EC-137]
MIYSRRLMISRLPVTLATVLLASFLPAVQANCFRNYDDGFYDGERRCLSTGARIGIAIGVAIFAFILVLSIYYYTRSRSSRGGTVVIAQGAPAPNIAPPPLPPPTFYGALPSQTNFGRPPTSQGGFVDHGTAFAPPPGPPPAPAAAFAGPPDAPPEYMAPPPNSAAGTAARDAYSGSKAYQQV